MGTSDILAAKSSDSGDVLLLARKHTCCLMGREGERS